VGKGKMVTENEQCTIQNEPLSSMVQLSCPECEKLIFTKLILENDDMELRNNIDHILKIMIGSTKHYSFRGIVNCECGNIVISCLTVSAHCNESNVIIHD